MKLVFLPLVILAELSFEPGFLMSLLGAVAFLLVIWNQAKAAFGTNPPNHDRFVAVKVYEKDQDKIDERLTDAARSRKEIHAQLDEQGQQIASIKTDNLNQTHEMRLLRASLEAMPQRIINLLDRKAP